MKYYQIREKRIKQAYKYDQIKKEIHNVQQKGKSRNSK